MTRIALDPHIKSHRGLSYSMPNDCLNRITVYADSDTISLIRDAGYDLLKLVPPLTSDEPQARVEAYGTDRFYYYTLEKLGKTAILFTFCTAWAPPLGFLEKLFEHHAGITLLKSDWDIATDGIAGVWVGERGAKGEASTCSIHWNEGCIEEQLERFGEILGSERGVQSGPPFLLNHNTNTLTWLHESLKEIKNAPILRRHGRDWEPVAGFSKLGSIFCIYKDSREYCVHAGDTWEEHEMPSLGYYSLELSWNELITCIAKKYDKVRAKKRI